ncbi:MAG TPA: hypothetical protein VFI31_22005 [Pirellulales bacterium]|nr:hypothetical protein [Pirellulales bacterium]
MNYWLNQYIHWSIGDPTETSISNLRETFPSLETAIDFDIVLRRLGVLKQFDRGTFGVSTTEFFPEVEDVWFACGRSIERIPNSLAKAELWLQPIAHDAGADAGLEAAVYLGSRGRIGEVGVDAISDAWHTAICRDIERWVPERKLTKELIRRARAGTVSLVEAAEVLRSGEDLPRFFTFRDEEEDHIDATMFRAVEWLNLTGFKPWLESCVADLSAGPQTGTLYPARGAWWLFHWCRSDLALSMAEKQGVESWLWAILSGSLERGKPWRLDWGVGDDARTTDYLPMALQGLGKLRLHTKTRRSLRRRWARR